VTQPTWLRSGLILVLAAELALAQLPSPVYPQSTPLPQSASPPAQTPAQTPAATPTPAPAAPTSPPTVYGGLSLNNASLTEVIDLLARQLKLNYILDPRVKGGVILNTYGETKNIDTRSLLETILRINGFGMVKQGDLYRIVPLADVSHLPIPLERDVQSDKIPEDDRTMLNLVFLKFVTVEELAKVLEPFIGENARMYSYAPANLLFILDSHRNMRRNMELISMFDSDTLANQRVKLFEVTNGRPSDLAKELETIAKAISLSEKTTPIKFLSVDRINTIIAIAPNPGAFAEVEKWLEKLDVPAKITAGAVSNYVYRVKYGQAQSLAGAIMALYGGYGGGYGGFGGGQFGGGYGGGGFGVSFGFPGAGGGFGGGFGGGQYGQFGGGQFGGGQYGGGQFGGGQFGGGGYGNQGGGFPAGGYGQNMAPNGLPIGGAAPVVTAGSTGAVPPGGDLTGSYLGNAPNGYGPQGRIPRVIPNPFDNTLLIQATPQEYEGILKLLRDLDVAPRQVLIEAKIYEVDLTGAFSSGVAATLQPRSSDSSARQLLASLQGATTNLTAGALVGQSRELLAAVVLQETRNKAKVISAPRIIATDSIPASINVGVEVPTLTAQAVTGVQQGGNSLFANTIASRSTGVTLNILARVNPTGIVTLVINQEVSSPQAPTSGGIQSPSFSKRALQTQITMQDGDTIAIGGIIDESDSMSTSGIPFLNRIPIIGAAFGQRSYSKERTELIVFMTPKVIYDTNQLIEASDELRQGMKKISKIMKD
jgi:general secretion pathway protein D